MTTRPILVDYADSPYGQFQCTIKEHGHREFLYVPKSACASYADDAISYRYIEAADLVEKLRQSYVAARIGPGHRVALLLENRPAYFFHWLALNAAGASVVPLNPDYRQAELSFVLQHSEVSLAVVLAHRVDDVSAAVSIIGDIPVVNETDVLAGLPLFEQRTGAKGRDAECALLYTSGTTGTPKGCMLSNDYFLRSGLRYMNRRGYVELEVGASRILTPLPMFHINAMAGSAMGVIFSGGCLIQLDRFHPTSWWQDVVITQATGAHCLGVMPALLLNLAPDEHDRAHALRYCTAANVEPQHHEAFEQRFGVPLIEGWAMTETGAGASISADQEPRHIGQRCFGRVPPNLDLKLVGEDGQEVCPGEPGEMLVRAKGDNPRLGFFSGYLKDAAATEAAWEGGWWHTGDVARMGLDGSLYFVDRKKNVIRRSGENISALEIEVVMRRHQSIGEVAVTSVPDAVRGDEVFAFIKPAAGAIQTPEHAREIVLWLGSQLAYFKAPGYVVFVDQLPVTSTQKVERGLLKQLAERHVTDGACVDLRDLKSKLRTLVPAGENLSS